MRYSASADRDPTPVDPSDKELSIVVDLGGSDKDGEEDRPGQNIYVNLVVDEDYEDNIVTFTYNGLQMLIAILFDQIEGLILYSREGVNLPPVTSMDNTPP